MKNNVPVEIYTELIVRQFGETSRFITKEFGQLIEKNGTKFLRYKEKIRVDDDLEETSVTVKLTSDKSIEVVRSGRARTKLRFVKDELVPSIVMDTLPVQTKTHLLTQNSLKEKEEVRVHYHLYSGEEKIGEYEMYLSYKK